MVAPDLATFLRCADKFAVTESARQSGFPAPRSFLCRTRGEIEQAADQIRFPLVAKARFSTGSTQIDIVRDDRELAKSIRRIQLSNRLPRVFQASEDDACVEGQDAGVVLQEYIPGGQEISFNILLDHYGSCDEVRFA